MKYGDTLPRGLWACPECHVVYKEREKDEHKVTYKPGIAHEICSECEENIFPGVEECPHCGTDLETLYDRWGDEFEPDDDVPF